ncbi:MAG: GCN5-related N-acetyltransferase [Acidimicrobiales bacterium]|nr:GCN5-related N-acetyltransferase [Acidimicrobiales bacterium]
MIRVRRIQPTDGPLLRATRLAALADSPGDSTTTVALNEAHLAEHWDRAAAANAVGSTQATYFASEEDGTEVVGMIGAYLLPDGAATMVGLWSAPGHRDVGVGDALVEAVLDWATRSGAERARLWVVERNEYARRFYESKGFEPTGETMPYEPEPTIQQVEMAKGLG